MKTMTVESVSPSKSGKSIRVKANDVWYGADKDSGIKAGQTIEAEIETTDYGPWIAKWKATSNGGEKPIPSIGQMMAAPWWMPFVSNCCAHAIQAGHIKEPNQISAWALKAMQAAIAINEEAP